MNENLSFFDYCDIHLLKPQPLPHQYWGLEYRTIPTEAGMVRNVVRNSPTHLAPSRKKQGNIPAGGFFQRNISARTHEICAYWLGAWFGITHQPPIVTNAATTTLSTTTRGGLLREIDVMSYPNGFCNKCVLMSPISSSSMRRSANFQDPLIKYTRSI